MSANETLGNFATVQKSFPGASVVSSTFDEFVDTVMADGSDALLPVITGDLADTWTWGTYAVFPAPLPLSLVLRCVALRCTPCNLCSAFF